MIFGLIGPVLLLAVIGGLVYWFRRSQGEEAAPEKPRGRISLLTEAVGYMGATLVLAGAGTAIGNAWEDLSDEARLSLLAGLTVFFLSIGFVSRRGTDPAFGRLTSVVWAIGTAGVAGTATQYFTQMTEVSGQTAFLSVASIVAAAAWALYGMHRMALQHVVLFVATFMTGLAVLARIDPEHAPWADGLVVWALALGWMLLGWRGLVEPSWVAVPIGMITSMLALTAMNEQPGTQWVMYVLGIGTGAGLMAFSVYARFTPGLALGSVGLFAYVTGAVVNYLGDALGIPVALASTGVVILVIAAVAARLARFTRTPPAEPHPGERPRTHLRKVS